VGKKGEQKGGSVSVLESGLRSKGAGSLLAGFSSRGGGLYSLRLGSGVGGGLHEGGQKNNQEERLLIYQRETGFQK